MHCALQVAELQAAVGAEAQQRQEAEVQLARAAQEAAEAAAAKQNLFKELAAEKIKVPSILRHILHVLLSRGLYFPFISG